MTAYTQYYAGGWKDSPLTTTPIVAAALQNIETGIATAQSTADTATTNAATAQTTANAATTKATLTTIGDIYYASGASTPARLGIGSANQQILAIGGIPTWGPSSTSTLTTTGDLMYASSANTLARLAVGTTGQYLGVTGGVPAWVSGFTSYKKTTTKDVTGTVAATDLLNGEITIGAGVMGTTGMVRMVAICDFMNNSGGAVAIPRLALKLGSTIIADVGTPAGTFGTTSTRYPLIVEAHIQNLTASSQVVSLNYFIGFAAGAGSVGVGGASGAGNVTQGTSHNSASAVNTAGALVLSLTTVNGSSSASYSTRLFSAYVQVLG